MVAVIFYLFLGGLRASAQDCANCTQITFEINKIDKDRTASARLLTDNQAMLKLISPGDVSKKVKLTSNILILSSQVETLENNRAVRVQDALKLGCKKCTPKKQTI